MSTSVRVLYFDDPGKPADAVSGSLRLAGYHVEQVHSLRGLERGLARGEASVLVLDISAEDDRAERIPAMVARHNACELTTVYFIRPQQRSPAGPKVIALKRPIASPALLRVLEHAIAPPSQVVRLASPPAHDPTLPALTVPPSLASSPRRSRTWVPLLLLTLAASGLAGFSLLRSESVAPVSAKAAVVAPAASAAPEIERAPARPEPSAAPEPPPVAPVAAPAPEAPEAPPTVETVPTPEPSSEPEPVQPRPRAKRRAERRRKSAKPEQAAPVVADQPPPPAPAKPDPLASAPESNPYKRGR